jgi:hypothetical protein
MLPPLSKVHSIYHLKSIEALRTQKPRRPIVAMVLHPVLDPLLGYVGLSHIFQAENEIEQHEGNKGTDDKKCYRAFDVVNHVTAPHLASWLRHFLQVTLPFSDVHDLICDIV